MKDSAGNALVENNIQRIRHLACTLVEDVCERTGLVFPCEHALWSWAGRHAAWFLSRFQVGKSLTAYEVTHGKKNMEERQLALLSRPMPTARVVGKADAKWRVGLMLGKTETQDAWIIGDGVDLMLRRSIRRVDRRWNRFFGLLHGTPNTQLCLPDQLWWKDRANKRKVVPQRQEARLLPKMSEVERRFADEEARAVLSMPDLAKVVLKLNVKFKKLWMLYQNKFLLELQYKLKIHLVNHNLLDKKAKHYLQCPLNQSMHHFLHNPLHQERLL